MKKLTLSITLTLILMGCAGPKAFTESGKVIPSKTNRIYIFTNDSPDTAYIEIGRTLQLNGFVIEYSDKSLGAIKASKIVRPDGMSVKVKPVLNVTVLKKNNSTMIQLHGTCNYLDVSTPIRLYGQKGSVVRTCWNAMYSIAKKYNGSTIKFDTK